MPSVSIIGMALMPLSQSLAWYLLWQATGHHRTTSTLLLYSNVAKIAAFYCAWALYNIVIAKQKDLGLFTMGLLAVAAYLEHRVASMVGTLLVLANFGFAAYFVLAWSPNKLAKIVKKTDTPLAIVWAYVFKCYFVVSILFWSVVLKQFYQLGEYRSLVMDDVADRV
jgi:hypothetical protein